MYCIALYCKVLYRIVLHCNGINDNREVLKRTVLVICSSSFFSSFLKALGIFWPGVVGKSGRIIANKRNIGTSVGSQ